MFWIFDQEVYWILAPRPGIEPVSPEVEAQSFNHRTAREVPTQPMFYSHHQPPQVSPPRLLRPGKVGMT